MVMFYELSHPCGTRQRSHFVTATSTSQNPTAGFSRKTPEKSPGESKCHHGGFNEQRNYDPHSTSFLRV